MKRHVSIFAFLLGAFAAGVASVAGAATTQTVYGGQYFVKEKYGGSDVTRMSIDGKGSERTKTGLADGSAVTFVATPDAGCKIAQWGVLANSQYPTDSMQHEKYTWTNSTSTSYVWTANLKLGSAVYLAVNFRYITYAVTYDATGGTPTPDAIRDQPYDESFNLATAPEKAGYAFAGWKPDTMTDRTYSAGQEVSGSDLCSDDWHEDGKTVKLSAQWTMRDYVVSGAGENCTVTVKASAGYDEDLSVSWTSDYRHPTVTVYSGTDDKGTAIKTYSNLGEGTTSVTFKMSDLNAYYENIFVKVSYEVYTITYNGNGGFFSNPMETSVTRRIENNTRIREFPEVHWDGDRMSLKGWYRATGSEIEVNIGDPYDFGMDMEFYAKWDPSSTFNISGEVLPSGAGRIEGTNSYVKGKAVTLTAFPANGYSFVEWRRGDVRITDSAELEVTVEGDAHYTAFFTGNVYTVKFDCDEDLAERALVTCPKSIKLTYGDPFGDLPVPTVGNQDYRFVCWMFEDETEITPDTIFLMSGKNNYIYAKVVPRPTYVIQYDGNGATSGSMVNQKMYCGVADNLTSNAYERIGYHFRGWATNAADAAALKIAYADGERVTDIASTNETVTLYAAWEAITLGEAMHCNDTSLVWDSSPGFYSASNPWRTTFGAGVGDGTDSCVRQTGAGSQQWLVAQVATNGSLSFRWKPTGCDGKLTFWVGPIAEDIGKTLDNRSGMDGEWSTFSTNGIPAGSWIHIYFNSSVGTCDIDQMTWTPGGREPTDADKVTISSAAVSDGKFKLSFGSKAEFAYNLLTNANLLIDTWGVMTNAVGTGEPITFEPQIIEGQPQMFYRVDTIQKK